MPLFVGGSTSFNRSKPVHGLKKEHQAAAPTKPTRILRTLGPHSPGFSFQLPERMLANCIAPVYAFISDNPLIQPSQYPQDDLSISKSRKMSVGCFSPNVSCEIFIRCFAYSLC